MKTGLPQLKRYLQETLGAVVNPRSWDGSKRLPFFLKALYAFFEVRLLDTRCLLMLDQSQSEQSPATIRKHMDQVQAKWDGEIVYVRERATAYNRKRLIDHKLPFLVPGNQMYLPMLGIDLREHFRKLRTEIQTFSPSTQALVIHALTRGGTETVFTPAGMAQRLGYSAMTMTRAFDELESAGLGEVAFEGRERYLRFPGSATDTWAKVEPFLRSPVKKRHHIKALKAGPPGPRAGLAALAHYTMLAEPPNPVVALSREEWASSLNQRQQITEIPAWELGSLEIEVWSYAPNLFAKGDVVDPISLYLSLKETQDERVEAALDEMMKGLPW